MILLIIALLVSTIATAEPIMLSPKELEAMGIPFEGGETSSSQKSHSKIRLEAIIYQNDTSWSIWINGDRYTYGQQTTPFKIIAVYPDHIEISLEEGKSSPLILTLGQTGSF